jgi:putative oxidoreductase
MAFGLSSIRPNWGALPLELISGVIFFGHGLQKLADPAGFAENALGGIPLLLAILVIAAEFGGGLLLLAGLLVRFAAFSHLLVMAVAIAQVHWENGLLGRGGFEFPLALLGISATLLIFGPDPISIDKNISFQMRGGRSPAIRGDSAIASTPLVKLAGAALLLAGIAAPLWRTRLGIPEGLTPLIICIVVGIASVFLGASLLVGKYWAYTPAFILARLYLGASAVMLFWLKYTLRGTAALGLSLLMVLALTSARRDP